MKYLSKMLNKCYASEVYVYNIPTMYAGRCYTNQVSRETWVYDLYNLVWKKAGEDAFTEAPVILGSTETTETSINKVNIENYNADFEYQISVDVGTFTRSGSLIDWSVGVVDEETLGTLSICAKEVSKLCSRTIKLKNTIKNIVFSESELIVYEGSSMNEFSEFINKEITPTNLLETTELDKENVIDTSNDSTSRKIYIDNKEVTVEIGETISLNEGTFSIGMNSGVYEDAVSVSCGERHTSIIRSDGSVWSVGLNGSGQLGNGTTTDSHVFIQETSGIIDAISVSCGDKHTSIIRSDGTVWSTGSNAGGQLGNGTTTDSHVFIQETSGIIDAIKISSGIGFNAIIKEDGTVWSTGINYSGQLGIDDIAGSQIYTQESTGITDAVEISCGDSVSMIIRGDGTVWSCGADLYNPYNDDDDDDQIEITAFIQEPTGITDASKVSVGYGFAAIIRSDGSVWSVGNNTEGQLGTGDNNPSYRFVQEIIGINDAVKISSGMWNTSIIKSDGAIWTTGNNANGQLGNAGSQTTGTTYFMQEETGIDDAAQISFGGLHQITVRANRTVWGVGDNNNGQLGNDLYNTFSETFEQESLGIHDVYKHTKVSLNEVKSIAVGGDYVAVIKEDGTVWGMGRNEDGELGTGDDRDKNFFTQEAIGITDAMQIACNYNHTYIIRSDRSIWCSGFGSVFTQETSGITGVIQIAAGYNGDALAIKSDGTVWHTNTNNFIQESTGITDAVRVAAGDGHYGIIRGDGTVWMKGEGSTGQLGNGGTSDNNEFTQEMTGITTAVEIACGHHVTMIIKEDGTVWGCGHNIAGSLGLGNESQQNTFVQEISGINNAIKVDCGWHLSMIVREDGTVWGAGDNREGTLGISNTNEVSIFTQASNIYDVVQISVKDFNAIALTNNENRILWATGRLSDSEIFLEQVSAPADILISVVTEYPQHEESFVVDYIGREGLELKSITKTIAAGLNHSMIIKTDGTVWGTGANNKGQLGRGTASQNDIFIQESTGITNAVAVACGLYHTAIIKSDGTVWSTGHNYQGQLGNNTTTNNTTFIQETSGISDAVKIACGAQHTVIIRSDGTVWSTGFNTDGQLGNGTTTDSHVFIQETSGITDAVEISCGDDTTMIIRDDGTSRTIWGAGDNHTYALGILNDAIPVRTFTQETTGITDVQFIASGYENTMIIKSDGTVWAIGTSRSGELGTGNTTDVTTWTQETSGITNAEYLSCSNDRNRGSSIVITEDGKAFSTGNNDRGQLGLGHTNDRSTFTEMTIDIDDALMSASGVGHTIILRKQDYKVWGTGSDNEGELGIAATGDYLTLSVDNYAPTSVEYTGNEYYSRYWVEPVDSLTQIPRSVYLNTHRAISNKITKDATENNFKGFENTFLKLSATDVGDIDNFALNTIEEIHIDNSLVQARVNEYFVTEHNEIFSVAEVKNDGATSSLGAGDLFFTKYWVVPKEPLTKIPGKVFPLSTIKWNTYNPEGFDMRFIIIPRSEENEDDLGEIDWSTITIEERIMILEKIDFLQVLGSDIKSTEESTVDSIKIDGGASLIEVGKTFVTDSEEKFTAKSVTGGGASSYIVTPLEPLATVPNAIYAWDTTEITQYFEDMLLNEATSLEINVHSADKIAISKIETTVGTLIL